MPLPIEAERASRGALFCRSKLGRRRCKPVADNWKAAEKHMLGQTELVGTYPQPLQFIDGLAKES